MTDTTESKYPSCTRVRVRLHRALDGALAPLEAALDRGHLEACAGCQRELAEHRRLLAAIRTLGAQATEETEAELELVTTAVLARLPALRVARPEPRWLAPVLVMAAAAVLLVVLFATRGTGPTPRAVDLATLDRFLEQLPSWADVVRGMNSLTRSL